PASHPASRRDHNRRGGRGSLPVRRACHAPPGDLRGEPGPYRPTVAHRAPGLPGGHALLRPVARARTALPPRPVRGGDPVIFVTLGTHEQPFDRALDLVAALARRETVLVQHGATPPRPGLSGVEWSEYLDWAPLTALMRDADVVITHAGVGSAVTAIRAGKKPVLVPRLARYGEHVDDHQLQIAERLAEFGLAVVCAPE